MSQVSRTVHQAINMALKLTGEYTPDDPPSGSAIKEALDILNLMLDGFAADGYQLPVYKEFTFSITAGTRDYKIKPETANGSDEVNHNRIIDVVTLVLNDGSADYPVYELPLNANELNTVINTSQGRPQNFSLSPWMKDNDNSIPYSRIRFYPYPSSGYTAKVRAKCYLDYLTLNETLVDLPANTHMYLVYELANQLVNIYPSSEQNWTAKKQMDYDRYRREFLQSSPVDLTITNSGLLMNRNGFYMRRLS